MNNHNSKIQIIFNTIFGEVFDSEFYVKLSTQEISKNYILHNINDIDLKTIRDQRPIYANIPDCHIVIDFDDFSEDTFPELLDSVCPNLHATIRSTYIKNFDLILNVLNGITIITEFSDLKIKVYYDDTYKEKLDTSLFNNYPVKKETLDRIHEAKANPTQKDELKEVFDRMFPVYLQDKKNNLTTGEISIDLVLKFA